MKGSLLRRLTETYIFIIIFAVYYGEVVEWFKALVLKTSEVQASVGSNPTLSAITEQDNAPACLRPGRLCYIAFISSSLL